MTILFYFYQWAPTSIFNHPNNRSPILLIKMTERFFYRGLGIFLNTLNSVAPSKSGKLGFKFFVHHHVAKSLNPNMRFFEQRKKRI